jgi:hypothetical protein
MKFLRRYWRRLLAVVLFILLISIAVFVIWASSPTGALLPAAQAALESNAQVSVQQENWLVFAPADHEATTGLILYPGGRVQAEAYAPVAHELAAEGFLVVIVPMPLNLAIFDINAADRVLAAYPSIQLWAIGGHSLGGAMAASYVKAHPYAVEGLVLWASYPQASDSLADQTDLAVTLIYGTRDGLATPEEIEAAKPYLPPSTQYVSIEGGNHANFASYGDQPGDLSAEIPRESQQQQVVEATGNLLLILSSDSTETEG